jgi:hypothetical protein
LPPWARKEIDAICRKFFWVGKDKSVSGKCMVAWQTACRPTELGGLGISDLRLSGYALQARWLWLQKADSARAWSELPIKTDPEVQAFFRASTYTALGDGTSTLFWEDRWLNGVSPSDMGPNLMAHVSARARSRLTVRQGLQGRHWTRTISGALGTDAIAEYLDIWEAAEQAVVTEQPDRTIWRWTPDGSYTAKSAYNMLHAGSIKFRGHSLIWKTWAPLRVKIFLWLSFRRRHWTNDRRARHGLESREDCYICDQVQETIDHLLCRCPFAREVWFHICTALGQPLPPPEHSVLRWWRRLRSTWSGNKRKGLDSLFALVSWRLWKERNARCFREAASTVPELLLVIRADADLWVRAGAKNLELLMSRE